MEFPKKGTHIRFCPFLLGCWKLSRMWPPLNPTPPICTVTITHVCLLRATVIQPLCESASTNSRQVLCSSDQDIQSTCQMRIDVLGRQGDGGERKWEPWLGSACTWKVLGKLLILFPNFLADTEFLSHECILLLYLLWMQRFNTQNSKRDFKRAHIYPPYTHFLFQTFYDALHSSGPHFVPFIGRTIH